MRIKRKKEFSKKKKQKKKQTNMQRQINMKKCPTKEEIDKQVFFRFATVP